MAKRIINDNVFWNEFQIFLGQYKIKFDFKNNMNYYCFTTAEDGKQLS